MNPDVIETAFIECGTDKAQSHGYHTYYARVFNKTPPTSILEIGVKRGASIQAWRMLFPAAKITGLDINDKEFVADKVACADDIMIGDSTDRKFTKSIKPHDIIIDDGSHFYKDIITTFENFADKFTKAYVIEDAMYNIDLITDAIKSQGFDKIEVLPSKVKQVSVASDFLNFNKPNDPKAVHREVIDLFMIVVYR